MREMTKAWELYEAGRSYNHRLVPDQYSLVETNTEFFAGNQWLHLPQTPAMRSLPKPTFNILKRVASLFIASLTSSAVTIRYEPLAYYDGGGTADPQAEAVRMANAAVKNLLEQFRFDYRVRQALFDGAQTGDYCAHFWFDPAAKPCGGFLGAETGELKMELVEGINVMFGDPNDPVVEHQPYILLVGRDTVESLKAEQALRGGWGEVESDDDNGHMTAVGGKTELEGGKALYLYLYRKAEGEVLVSKVTKTAVIYEDVKTGLTRYPIAWGNWERQRNQYHGRALVTGLVPNQIFINSMFATAMRHLQLMAFPKTVYNADMVAGWTNEVGQAIAVHGLQPGQSVREVAYNLQPAEMSSQIFALIDKAMAYTKECLGATDAQLGTARAENTSALIVLQTNAQVPLENIRSGLYEWVEDVGLILLDMMAAYYGERSIVTEREFTEMALSETGAPVLEEATGRVKTEKRKRTVIERFDFTRFRDLYLKVSTDVGESTYFSEIAMTQTLDNLRREGAMDLIQYLERVPEKLIPRKAELIAELKEKGGAA